MAGERGRVSPREDQPPRNISLAKIGPIENNRSLAAYCFFRATLRGVIDGDDTDHLPLFNGPEAGDLPQRAAHGELGWLGAAVTREGVRASLDIVD